jgi:CMP-N-acetylneuraminic acid synthetase
MSTICLICARGGSKGVPGKNIRPLGGIPLIGHAIRTALLSGSFTSVIVSTDSQEIATVARSHGAEVPFMRPPELASDHSGKVDAMLHAVETLMANGRNIEEVVDLDPTVPFLTVEEVNGCLRMLREDDCDTVVGVTQAHINPYFNMVEMNSSGFLQLSKSDSGDLFSAFKRRQDCPQVYSLHGLIGFKVAPFLKNRHVYNRRTKAVICPPERSLMIDTELEFRFAEFLSGDVQKKAQR